ncbi:hypothetical protein ACRALDRAFT_2112518 [Sodiomyces alcalophilus JCM 7366]|uniref:uncharacterized protein n=1 Tax=Sodiomyces alcalophilus JCM 7366 TaxID=591952 RepID=UPI0039B3FEBC
MPSVRAAAGVAGQLFWVVVLYLLSELLIWSISIALRQAALEYFKTIFGMVVVFLSMTLLNQVCKTSDEFYHLRIKSKVDFINKNLGLGFPVPLVAIDQDETLSGKEIGAVIGNFVLTNIIFWPLIFVLAWAFLAGVSRLPRYAPRKVRTAEGTLVPDSRAASTYFSDIENIPPQPEPQQPQQEVPKLDEASKETSNEESGSRQRISASLIKRYYPIVLSLFFVVTVAIPVSHQTGDDRLLDGCVMWFTWITSTRLQGMLTNPGPSSKPPSTPLVSNAKRALITLLNPVLLTSLAMTAYTRAKSAATNTPLSTALATFTSGTPLSDLWSYQASIYPLKPSQTAHFGAGDAALSLLESGIVVWGFKLHECRSQLASRAGVVVILVSAAAAALNAFAAPLLGHFALGLAAAPSLAFSARCTTLALARPAVEALDGNHVVNAALVVSNGIVGQLLYPFVLGKLGVVDAPGSQGNDAEKQQQEGQEQTRPGVVCDGGDANVRDGAMIVAAGTTIGINGAAMGVSYLYERKSRAAPYAALSMTVFGVMTVVFTAVEPFRGTLKALMR